MATENVGGIQYTVDADTAAMLKAEAVVNKSIAKQVAQFEKADQAVRGYITTQKEMGRTINQMGQVMDKNGNIVRDATLQYRALASMATEAFQKASNSSGKLSTSVSGVSNAVRGAKPNMANFSYQLQDIAVQAQMGTNAFIIMSQQIPQMLIGMGSLAAGIGAGVAVLGLLATTMINTKSNADLLQKSIGNLKAVMTVGSGGIVEYTEQMQELGRISEIVAKQRIAIAMRDANDVVKRSVDEMASKLSEVDDTILAAQLGFFTKSGTITRQYAVQIGNLLGEQGNYLDRTGDKADEVGRKFVKLFQDLRRAKSPKAVTDIQEQLIALTTASDKADKKFIKMFESLMIGGEDAEDFFTTLRNATAVLETATKNTTDYSNATNKTKDTTAQLVLELIQQKVALEQGERAALAFKLQLDGLSESEKEQVLALYDSNKATEEKTEATKEYEKSLKDVNDQLDAFFENESRQSTDKDAQQTATLTRQVQSIGLTPEEEIQAQYERELELLRQAEEKKIEIEGTYAERRKQLEAERIESLRALHTENNQFLQDAFANLDTQIAGTMTQVVIGAKDGETAMRDLANTMLTQVIGAAVQYGIELVKNKVLGQALAASEQAGIVATTATGVASQQTATASTAAAAATTATAAAPAAALTSTFSFGSAALIGGAALLGTLAISKMMASGAREFGGPVTAGKSYLVGERGPEMFTPNTSGGITSNKDMNGSGGGGMTVNISNNTPYDVFVTRDEAANIANVQIGREAGKLASGRGQMASAMKRGAGTQFNGAN